MSDTLIRKYADTTHIPDRGLVSDTLIHECTYITFTPDTLVECTDTPILNISTNPNINNFVIFLWVLC